MFNNSRFAGKLPNSVLKLVMAGCGALVLANCMGSQTQEAEVSEVPQGTTMGKDGQSIVKDVFVNDHDLELIKGKAVSKGTFILKPDQTEEDYIKTSSGPWEFSGLDDAKALEKKANSGYRIQTVVAFQEARVISGNSAAACPVDGTKGYVKLNLDLNRGAGGPYLFFCVATVYQASYPQVRHITINNSSSGSTFTAGKPTSPTQGLMGIGSANSDLNQGAGGQYVWGRFDNGGCWVEGFGVTFKDHWWETTQVPSGWLLADETDLNYDAGGAYMWALVKQSCP